MNNQETLFSLPELPESNIPQNIHHGKPRLKIPIRNQVKLKMSCLDDELKDDHKVRFVWEYVCKLNLEKIISTIKSVENNPGSSAIDPRILFTLWLYAFTEGIISARLIARYCEENIAFKWICGEVSINYHTISDFRTSHGEALDELLTQSVGVLSHQGLVSLDRVAQDGMKIEADAGKGSFHRQETLTEHLEKAEAYVKTLEEELKKNPNNYSTREAAAKKRVAEERVQKLEKALDELEKHRKSKTQAYKNMGKKLSEKEKKDMRASTTDPESRNMKMPNGGFAPAYNAQFVSDTKSKAILGVAVTQSGHDYGQLSSMQEQLKQRYGEKASEILVDAGYLNYKDVEHAAKDSKIYVPSETIKEDTKQSTSLLEIKKRMETDTAKEIYKERAATAEFVNARTRNRGLKQLLVKGLKNVTAVVTLYAIGNNMLIWLAGR
jgi:transposase